MPETTKKESAPPLVYADRENGNRPICLACFVRHKKDFAGRLQSEQWSQLEISLRAQWESIPEGERKNKGIDGPLGWVELYLDSLQWPRVKGRCWGCARFVASLYSMLTWELRSQQKNKDFYEQCCRIAFEANNLALEFAASKYQPGKPISEMSPRYDYISRMVDMHMDSICAFFQVPDIIKAGPYRMVDYTFIQMRRGLFNRFCEFMASRTTLTNYDPLDLGAEKLREVAVFMRQEAELVYSLNDGFAGVVSSYAKDPNNPPERLALVVTYQQAQQMVPPMGYGELARALIEYDQVDGKWSKEDASVLKENIQKAVKKYRSLMPIPRHTYYLRKEGTSPP